MSSKILIRLIHQAPIISRCSPPSFVLSKSCYSQGPAVKDEKDASDTISKAMQSYMERAKEHQEFMDKEEKEFSFGRRHLANMMGKDVESFTQDDINEAIRYLFPSGLFEKSARPMMKPPQEIYPKQTAARFDLSGRPHHPFFYTAQPNFLYLMHEMVKKLNKMNLGSGGLSRVDDEHINLAGSTWITKEELETRLMERISDKQYAEWISCMTKMAFHPQREIEINFLKGYRKSLARLAKTEDLPPVTLEADGRKSCYVPVCMQKTARGEVKVTLPGTGRFNINGEGLEYFKTIQSRESAIAPLQFTGLLGKVDVDAYVMGADEGMDYHDFRAMPFPGESARAGCVRWGVATALAALGADVEKLRLAGLLSRERRTKERKKPGRTGAREKWTWKKR